MSSRDRSVLGVVVLIIIAVAGYFLLVQPKHHQAAQLKTQINAAETSLNQVEAQVRADLVDEAQYKTYSKQLKSITAAVPSDGQIPQLIIELQAASSKNKVGFESVAAAAASSAAAVTTSGTTTTSFPSQGFTLSLTGSYFSVANLLGTLASFVRADDKHFKVSGRLISINSVALSPGGTNSSGTGLSSGGVTANVSVLDYDVPTSLLTEGTATTTSTGAPSAP